MENRSQWLEAGSSSPDASRRAEEQKGTLRTSSRGLGTVAGLVVWACLVVPVVRLAAQYPPPAPGLPSDVRVDSDLPGTAASLRPCAVGTDDGVLHVVWQDHRGPTWGIWYRRIADPTDVSSAAVEQELSAFSQPPGVILGHGQPAIASDGSQALYVVWHASDGTFERILFVRSSDGGLTWSTPSLGPGGQLNLAIQSEYAGPPRIVADGGGHVQVAWAQSDGVFDQIWCVASGDWGASFTTPLLNQPVNLVRTGHSEGVRLASDGKGGVYVAWLDHRDPAYRDVFLRRSLDHGLSFEPQETRLSAHGTAHELELLAETSGLSSQILVLAAWIEIHPAVNGVPVTFLTSRHSLDGAATFPGMPQRIAPAGVLAQARLPAAGSGGPGGGGGGGQVGGPPAAPPPAGTTPAGSVTAAPRPSVEQPPQAMLLDLALAGDGQGNVWAAYSRIDAPMLEQPSQVLARRFDGASALWGAETRLSRPGARFPHKGVLPALPRASLAARGADVVVTWMHSGNAFVDTADVVLAFTQDGGLSWSGPWGATTKTEGPGLSRSAHPQAVLFPGQAVLLWDDRRHWTPPQSQPLPPGAPLGNPDIYCNVLALSP